jgi:uncharacterized Zn finger protein
MPTESTTPIRATLPPCPHCWQDRGIPHAVLFGSEVRTVTYHCPSCGHAWQVQDSGDSRHTLFSLPPG